MKKLIAALAAAFMLTLGLVAVSEAPATAACPYSGCINSTTIARAKPTFKRHHSARIKVTVSAPGNAVPQGTLSLVVTKLNNGKVKFAGSQAYTGGRVKFITRHLAKRGKFVAVATFTPATNSVFNGSTGSASFSVV
jgi:hypothetical protein